MKQTTIRMHMNPEEALGTINHVLEKEFRDREAHVNPQGEFEVCHNFLSTTQCKTKGFAC